MTIQEKIAKRNDIASCIITLKNKSLKKMRRKDLDEAIQLLLDYDKELKTVENPISVSLTNVPAPQIIDGNEDPNKRTPRQKKNIEIEDKTKVIIINDKVKGSFAYKYNEDMFRTPSMMAALDRGMMKPIGKVIIQPWMTHRHANEICFIDIFRTTAVGHIIKVDEFVVDAGHEVSFENSIHMVKKVEGDKVWLHRGIRSFIPVNLSQVKPIKSTSVSYFNVDSWG